MPKPVLEVGVASRLGNDPGTRVREERAGRDRRTRRAASHGETLSPAAGPDEGYGGVLGCVDVAVHDRWVSVTGAVAFRCHRAAAYARRRPPVRLREVTNDSHVPAPQLDTLDESAPRDPQASRIGWVLCLTDEREIVRFTALGSRLRAMRHIASPP